VEDRLIEKKFPKLLPSMKKEMKLNTIINELLTKKVLLNSMLPENRDG